MMSSGYLSSANLIYAANDIDIRHGAVVFPLDGQLTVFALAYSFAEQAAAQSVIEDVRWARRRGTCSSGPNGSHSAASFALRDSNLHCV